MRQRILALTALCALIVTTAGCASSAPSKPAATTTSDRTTTAAGVPTCPLATLPPQAADTVGRIHSNGPFPFPRNDGVVFGNREQRLPKQTSGYYREYTVMTPGARNRSTRRIITGGAPVNDPSGYYYTADHYDSFCSITGAGRP